MSKTKVPFYSVAKLCILKSCHDFLNIRIKVELCFEPWVN